MFQDDLTSEDLNKSDLFVVNSAGDVPLLAAARKARYIRLFLYFYFFHEQLYEFFGKLNCFMPKFFFTTSLFYKKMTIEMFLELLETTVTVQF